MYLLANSTNYVLVIETSKSMRIFI